MKLKILFHGNQKEGNMKKKKSILCCILVVILAFTTNVNFILADTSERLTIPSHGIYSDGNLYYAFGQDGGGSLYRYDLATKKKKCLVSKKCAYISSKGNYIYYSCNLYKGTSSTDYYVGRIRKNGTGNQKLASGYCPTIIGNYIYYIATQKTKDPTSSTKVSDLKTIGLYRMGLDGSNKKCVYKSSDIKKLATGLGKIYFKLGWNNNIWKYVNISTGKIYSANISSHQTNTNFYYGFPEKNFCNVIDRKYRYSYSNGTLYKTLGNTQKKLSVGGSIKKIICTENYLYLVTEKGNWAYAYAMKNNGTSKIGLQKWYLAGGGWNY